MNPISTDIIQEEHAALSAKLLLLPEHRRQDMPPDFAVLRAMLFYVDDIS